MVAEKTIEAIIEEPGLSAKLEGAAFTTLHERLAESVNAIVALILAMKDDGVVLDVQPAHPTPAPASAGGTPPPTSSGTMEQAWLLLSSIRLLGSWYAEEDSEMSDVAREAVCYVMYS